MGLSKMQKRLEDERMKEKHTDSVQNRFTAYLVAAVGNTRKNTGSENIDCRAGNLPRKIC